MHVIATNSAIDREILVRRDHSATTPREVWKALDRPSLIRPTPEAYADLLVRRVLGRPVRSEADLIDLCDIAEADVVEVQVPGSVLPTPGLLRPRASGGFLVVLSERMATSQLGRASAQWVTPQLLRPYVLAHELGHMLFYHRTTTPARRAWPASDAEEVFCDAFAHALLTC